MQQLCRYGIAGILALVVATVAIVGGCRKPTATAVRPQPRWAGVTLRVAAAAGPPLSLIKQQGRAWANNEGATLVETPFQGEWPDADLVLVPAADLPRWAAARKAAPLPRPEAVDPFMPVYRTRLLTWEGKPFGLPLIGDGAICVYRLDIYDDAANKQAFRDKFNRDLQPPESWEEFGDQAEYFAARRARPSLPPLPADDAATCAALEAIAAPLSCIAIASSSVREGAARSARAFSFQYDVDTGQPRLAEPGFVEALTLLKRMQPHRAKTATVADAMKNDQAVLGYITLVDLAALGPSEARRWGVFRTPGSRRVIAPEGVGNAPAGQVNYLPFVGAGATVGFVTSGSAQADAAFDLLSFLSGPVVSTEVVHDPKLGSGPFREIHLDRLRESGWLNYGLNDQQTVSLRTFLRDLADPRADNPALALRIPDRKPHIEVLAREIRAVLAGGDPAAAMRTAADRWRELDGSPAKARTEFRRSVGLRD